MDTNLYWRVRGTFEEKKALLAKTDRAFLEAAILDDQYNSFLRSRSDCADDDEDRTEVLYGKRVPYMGWFYRHMEFSEGRLPLGFSDGYVAFMANNKWDHHQRDTTPEEFSKIVGFIDEAMAEDQKGGNLAEIVKNTRAKLKLLRDYLQTLPRATDS